MAIPLEYRPGGPCGVDHHPCIRCGQSINGVMGLTATLCTACGEAEVQATLELSRINQADTDLTAFCAGIDARMRDEDNGTLTDNPCSHSSRLAFRSIAQATTALYE